MLTSDKDLSDKDLSDKDLSDLSLPSWSRLCKLLSCACVLFSWRGYCARAPCEVKSKWSEDTAMQPPGLMKMGLMHDPELQTVPLGHEQNP